MSAGGNLAQFFMLITVNDICFGGFFVARVKQYILDHILDVFDTWHMAVLIRLQAGNNFFGQ